MIVRPVADTMPLVTELEYVPSGLPIATTSWPTLSASDSPSRGRRQVGPLDLDDGQVGQRVDAVDGAGQDPAVLELDVELARRLRRRACW